MPPRYVTEIATCSLRSRRSRQTTQPVPQHDSPYLCPLEEIESTFGRRKSQAGRSSWNGAMNPPDAASTWMPTCQPLALFTSVTTLSTSHTGSYWPP